MVCAPVLPCVKESYKPVCRAEARRQMRLFVKQGTLLAKLSSGAFVSSLKQSLVLLVAVCSL